MTSLLSYALCTVDDVKELLGIDAGNTSKDNLIRRKINYATELIENYCQRRFQSTTYTDEEYNGEGSDCLVLRNYPIITFTNISYRDTAENTNSWTTIDSQDYFVDYNAGIIKYLSSFNGGFNRYKVTYSAGYNNIPSDIIEACATIAAFLVDNPIAGTTIKRKQEGQRSIEYYDTASSSSLIDTLGLDDVLDAYAGKNISGLR